jgi:hypothetical protein
LKGREDRHEERGDRNKEEPRRKAEAGRKAEARRPPETKPRKGPPGTPEHHGNRHYGGVAAYPFLMRFVSSVTWL